MYEAYIGLYFSTCPTQSPCVLAVLTVINSPQLLHSHKCLEDNYVSSLLGNAEICLLGMSGILQLGGWKITELQCFLPLESLNTCCYTFPAQGQSAFLPFSAFWGMWNSDIKYPWAVHKVRFYIIRLKSKEYGFEGNLLSSYGWTWFLAEEIFLISIYLNSELILLRYKLLSCLHFSDWNIIAL